MKNIFIGLTALLVLGIFDFQLSNRASTYLLKNDVFFDDHLKAYRDKLRIDDRAYGSEAKPACEAHDVFLVYSYKVCFELNTQTRRGSVIRFLYYKPLPILLSLTGTEFLRGSYYGAPLKTLNENYTIIHSMGAQQRD